LRKPLDARPSWSDRLLRPLHRWVWVDPQRKLRKLFRFAETEEEGGRDISRAAELTSDPLLRRLFLRHAADEQRHADLFRARGRTLLAQLGASPEGALEANWLAPGERGLDALEVEGARADELLAFLHLSEKAAAGRFVLYREVLEKDPLTRDVFDDVLHDEVFHMGYTRSQLARIAPRKQGLALWRARAGRLWKAYLRVAAALASVGGTIVLTLQYFLVLPLFAWAAKRQARKEAPGFRKARAAPSLRSQY
jgi:rubrerythrin